MAKAHEQRRQRAIDKYLAGDPIEDICRDLACAKSWLYKWRDRYLATDPSWSAELRRWGMDMPARLLLTREAAIRRTNSVDISRENTLRIVSSQKSVAEKPML